MRRKQTQDSVEWLEFYSLSQFKKELVQGVFCRKGGDSLPPYDSLNVSLSVGDDPPRVQSNRKKIQDIINVPKMVFAEQVHGTEVALVTEGTEQEVSKCDSLVTKKPGIALVIKHADCQAALFFDPTKKTIAAAHCGWRGSVHNIYAKTIDIMQKMGSNVNDIIVCISPSLGPEHSKLEGIDVILPDYFYYFQKPTGDFDFWAISYKQLIDKGIRPQNIEIARICTYEDKENFFSYRRDKITGRNATLISLREPV